MAKRGANKQRRVKPAAWLRRRRQRRTVLWAVLVVCIGALAVADRAGLLLYEGDTVERYDGRQARVTRVIDGDTLEVIPLDGPGAPGTRVRLWGVDCPEMAWRDPPRPAEPWAEQATALARELAADRIVTLYVEPHRVRGNYGRLLAYVTLPNGSMLNERLLLAGLAHADDRWAHRHLQRFAMLERQARRDGVGIWSEAPP